MPVVYIKFSAARGGFRNCVMPCGG